MFSIYLLLYFVFFSTSYTESHRSVPYDYCAGYLTPRSLAAIYKLDFFNGDF